MEYLGRISRNVLSTVAARAQLEQKIMSISLLLAVVWLATFIASADRRFEFDWNSVKVGIVTDSAYHASFWQAEVVAVGSYATDGSGFVNLSATLHTDGMLL